MAIPEKPSEIVVDIKGRKFRLELNVDVYKAYPLKPVSERQVELAAQYGPMWRIIWCRRTYGFAVERAQELMLNGTPEDRIEFVCADREEMDAFKRGDLLAFAVEE